MQNPPQGVRLVMEAICIMKDIKPDRKIDANGKHYDDYWAPAKRVFYNFNKKFFDLTHICLN